MEFERWDLIVIAVFLAVIMTLWRYLAAAHRARNTRAFAITDDHRRRISGTLGLNSSVGSDSPEGKASVSWDGFSGGSSGGAGASSSWASGDSGGGDGGGGGGD